MPPTVEDLGRGDGADDISDVDSEELNQRVQEAETACGHACSPAEAGARQQTPTPDGLAPAGSSTCLPLPSHLLDPMLAAQLMSFPDIPESRRQEFEDQLAALQVTMNRMNGIKTYRTSWRRYGHWHQVAIPRYTDIGREYPCCPWA